MKKTIISMFLIFAMLIVNATFVLAESTDEPKPILDVIRDQGDYTLTDNVYNKAKYGEGMEGYDLSEEFMIKVYLGSSFLKFEHVAKSLEEQKEQMRKDLGILHVAFQGDNRIENFRELPDGTICRRFIAENYLPNGIYNYNIRSEYPKYIQDIMNSSIYESDLHLPDTKYTEIVCFTGEMNQTPTCVYYIGDNRTIVRCYDNYSADGFDMLWEDFRIYAAAYYNVLGEGLIGGYRFSSLVNEYTIDNIKGYYEKAQKYLENNNQTETETENENLTTGTVNNPTDEKESGASALWWILPTAAAILLAGGAIAFVTYRKKKA